MPKLKTSKSAAKRIVKITKNNKMIRRKMSAQHLAAGKSKRAKRASRKTIQVSKKDQKKIRKLVPYK
jgi:ribosomal protein L35